MITYVKITKIKKILLKFTSDKFILLIPVKFRLLEIYL